MNPYIGHEFQLFGVEEYTLNGGKKEGMKILHVKNGLDLDMTISLDRGGDISSLSLHGKNISYLTPNGYVSSKYYDDKGSGWIKSFTAGFLTTCGFNNVGTPSIDEDGEHPLHGCVNQIPVDSYSYEVLEDEIVIKTILLDEYIFNRKLKRIRTIKISLKSNDFSIHDEIINRGDLLTPVMCLYHMNMGYPLLKEDSIIEIDSKEVIARDEHAKKGIDRWNKMEKPTPGYQEMCYYHKMKSDKGLAKIYSPSENIGVIISYDSKSLTQFTEWKMMGVRDYVLGLEPGNVNADGYTVNKSKGLLTYLKPNEKLDYVINIKLVDNLKDFSK